MAKTSAVEKTPAGGALAVPSFMKDAVGRGTENFETGSYEFPRIKLLQGISEELQTYDGVKSGEFFHTLAESSLGQQVAIVPLHISTRYVLWAPRKPIDAGGILARADDGVHWNPANAEFTVKVDKRGNTATWNTRNTVAESGLDQWGTFDPSDPKSPPAATQVYMMVVALPDFPDLSPVALLLQRASIKPARALRGKLKFSRAPIYGTRFVMSSFVDGDTDQLFNNYRFTAAGFVEDEDEYKFYEQMYENFEKAGAAGLQARDLDEAQDDAPVGSDRREAAAAASGERRF